MLRETFPTFQGIIQHCCCTSLNKYYVELFRSPFSAKQENERGKLFGDEHCEVIQSTAFPC